MRIDTNIFDSTNAELSKEPRYIVGIDFDGSITYITSHDGIPNVPGTPIENALTNISATTQTLNPDKANATVGTMSFSLIDEANAFTDLVRTKLDADIGLKGRTVTFHLGFEGIDFTEFVLFQTQVIRSAQTKGGFYQILCADIQRETKTRIFELALTFLTTSISDTATTISVLDLSGFEGNNHGTSYTDAPGENVIYIQIDQTKEVIRCPVSGIVGNDFTDVTRGALSTKAKAVDVDVTLPSSRRPQVKEYVYLELPAVKLAYAILTGDIEGTADVLPSGWHAGVSTAFVRLTDFTTIGTDLWDPADDTQGLVPRFEGLDAQDAKRFLETELYLLLGCFSPVYADGQLGLKRMVPSLVDSPYVVELNDQNVTGHSTLTHDMESVLNNIRIDWNWNGTRFIRSTIFTDSTSIARHGLAPQKRIGFRGLAGTQFTEGLLGQMITSLRDMYTGPPLRLDVRGFLSLNQLEIGDPVRVDLTGIRDFSNTPANLQRTMVIHGMTVNMMQGVRLKLFGSSERLTETSPTADTSVLPAAFYPDIGTALSSIPGLMTGDVTNAGMFTLIGSSDMNAAASIFYHDGPLTISSTTTIIVENNVQLRVNGFLTINGTIDGIENGHPGGTDSTIIDTQWGAASANAGVQGFIGNSWSASGILLQPVHSTIVTFTTAYFTPSLYDAFPNIVTQVDASGNGSISGIPADMRGGGAAAGGRVVERNGGFKIKAVGGDGGTGGAGLCIISKGGDFGASGAINLSGGDGVENDAPYITEGLNFFAGTGGAGVPGALLWLLDGSAVTFPDLLGKYTAITGEVQVDFPTDMPFFLNNPNHPAPNIEAFIQADRRISLFDHSGTNFRIQYLAADDSAIDDQDVLIVAPTGLTATGVFEGVRLNWTNPPQETLSHIEIHASDDDVRANAIKIDEVFGETYLEFLTENQRTRFYWIRAVDDDGTLSDFEPDTADTTATADPLPAKENIVIDPDFDKSPDGGTPAIFWGKNQKNTGTVDFVTGGGANSSNAFDLQYAQDVPPAVAQLLALKRHRLNHGVFTFHIRYQTFGSLDSLGHPINVLARRYDSETGASVDTIAGGPFTLPRSFGSWSDATLRLPVPDDPTKQFFSFGIEGWPVNQSSDTLRIDSIFVYPGESEFGVRVYDGDLQPGAVPLATAAQSGLFLKGDATWAAAGGGGGVDSFEGRTGVVTVLQADYDSFFLTPAEGDAAYSLLGHSHVPADIIFAATNRFLARDTAGGGPGEEITAAAARTILNVEDGSTADQTAGEIEAIVNHDNLIGFLGAEHVDWAVTGAEDIHPDRIGSFDVDRLIVGGNDKLVAISASQIEVRGSIIGSNPPVDTDDGNNSVAFTNSDDTVVWGSLDFGSGAIGGITNSVRGQTVSWRATKVAGGLAGVFFADPDAGAGLAFNDGQRIITLDAGIRVSRAATGASVYIEEAAAASSDVPADGQFWVRNDAPNTPMFTDDTGVDHVLNASGGPVDSVFGRTGAVVALQADYDGFFLTPAEGDAAYSLLGHAHAAADITSGIFAAARIPNPVANSSLLGGLGLAPGGGAPGANKVIRSQGSGYTYFSWINTVSGATSSTLNRVYCSQDSFVRFMTPANFVTQIDNHPFNFSSTIKRSGLGVAYWTTSGQTIARMTISTAAASGGANGDIHFRY